MTWKGQLQQNTQRSSGRHFFQIIIFWHCNEIDISYFNKLSTNYHMLRRTTTLYLVNFLSSGSWSTQQNLPAVTASVGARRGPSGEELQTLSTDDKRYKGLSNKDNITLWKFIVMSGGVKFLLLSLFVPVRKMMQMWICHMLPAVICEC